MVDNDDHELLRLVEEKSVQVDFAETRSPTQLVGDEDRPLLQLSDVVTRAKIPDASHIAFDLGGIPIVHRVPLPFAPDDLKPGLDEGFAELVVVMVFQVFGDSAGEGRAGLVSHLRAAGADGLVRLVGQRAGAANHVPRFWWLVVLRKLL